MFTFLRRIEDLLVQVVRVVLLAFSLVVLVALALWVWDSVRGNKSASSALSEPAALNWKDAKLDLAYVVAETGRDLGNSQIPLAKRLSDPLLRPSFQQADQAIRAFINQNPAQRERVESESGGRGLAPLNVLLQGKDMPDAALVQRLIKDEQENGRAAYVSSEDSDDEENGYFSEPLEVAYAIHERAQMAESEHGAGAYVAYVQGLPAALQQVFGNADLAPQLQQQAASSLMSMVLTNYTITFDQAARVLRGDSSEDGDTSLLNLYNKAAETAFWSMLMSLLVLVVMVVVFIRMERHLRVMSERPQRAE
ncbi:hypothetical protein [Comamonas sp. GB3 AK4-5]|uniref:hypothetical protein n=1 Tax=Comamonas sp. GB3 AK4-5 TaxID=3231487 RepID=UPI00351F776C